MSTKMIVWYKDKCIYVVREEDEMRFLEIYQHWFEKEQFIREEVGDFFLTIWSNTTMDICW